MPRLGRDDGRRRLSDEGRRLGFGQRAEEQVMEERERDERVEGVGEELLLGEGEVGGLEVVGGDHGCVRAQEEETMAMAGRRRTTGAGVKKGIEVEEDKGDAGDGNVFFFSCVYLFPFSLSKDEGTHIFKLDDTPRVAAGIC
jgi:hypothetical protein